MEKSLIALALLAATSACATTPAQERSAAASSAAEAKTCKVVEDEATGSLINRRQECQTPARQKAERR